jgi:hypothetical protein
MASCRSIFGERKILPVTSLYTIEILSFIVKNKIYTTQYSDIHRYNTIHKYNCMYSVVILIIVKKKSVINMGTKIFNSLPVELKRIDNLEFLT